jgi:NADH-quinone oxidoreductase subunit L
MWIPLAVLAVLAVVGGGLNLPFSHDVAFIDRWLEPVLGENLHTFDLSGAGKVFIALAALVFVAIGLLVGWTRWSRADRPELEPAILKRAWGVDALYDAIIVRPGAALSNFSAWVVDRKIVDGAVNGVAVLVREGGGQVRRLQTGYVRNYALGVAAGTVLLLGWFAVRAT